ncbi:transposase, partial [Gemmata algarum]|uniref:transposase n=1 Tax=Gemmata algarum TaxID=2975278 RepID=UPI002DD6A6D8
MRRCASRPVPRRPRKPCGWTRRRSRRPTAAAPRGTTGGKKVNGRKRFIGVDSLGLIWALSVVTADVQDRDGGRWLRGAVRHRLPRVREVIADSGFSERFQEFVRHVCRWAVTITANAKDGFKVHTRRWVVERTFAWFVRYRRLMVDYEYHTETTEAMIQA